MNKVERRYTQVAHRDTQKKHLRKSAFALRKSASLAIEYAVLVALVVAALLAMQAYVKRAICGRWRAAADTIGFGRQYPGGTQ